MLWRKESKKTDSVYVDIFALNGGETALSKKLQHFRSENTCHLSRKNDATAEQNRKEGNADFIDASWSSAMESYKESLLYAENGSKNISLAYANRSYYFRKLGLYDECLIDIDLAKASGFPAELMPKLDRRKKKCLKAIENAAHSTKFEVKLSYEPDDQFPCMANVLKMQKNEHGLLRVVAKEDIDVGQVIAVERLFVTYAFIRRGWQCNICIKAHANFVPCKNCTLAMFCHKDCQEDSLHEYECGRRFCDDNNKNGLIMKIVRMSLFAINMFSSADDLMNFVEPIVKCAKNQMPSTLTDAKSQYEAFLKRPIKQNPAAVGICCCYSYEVFNILMAIPKVNSMFASLKHRRFLMHLICHHREILGINGTTMNLVIKTDSGYRQIVCACDHTSLILKYFELSCAPNVLSNFVNGRVVFIVVRPVAKGEQLTFTNSMAIIGLPKQQRKRALWEHMELICECVRCEGATASTVKRQQMILDSNFRYITLNDLKDDFSEQATQMMIDKCQQFLQTYGRIAWCDELAAVVKVYIKYFFFRYRKM